MSSSMSKLHSLTWIDQSPAADAVDDGYQTLIQRCLEGDEFAFQMLYNQHSGYGLPSRFQFTAA